jgi:hypothetical protein
MTSRNWVAEPVVAPPFEASGEKAPLGPEPMIISDAVEPLLGSRVNQG